jgi:glycosyltransferase involved in cell wall biosynthesis
MAQGPLTIFIVHPSELLTDHRPHGDGIVAYGFISELARRGHRVHVACQEVDVRGTLPPNVELHPIVCRKRGIAGWLEYAFRVRMLFRQIDRRERVDVAHQLNPVFSGLSLALLGCNVPIVLGTYVASWPQDAVPSTRPWARFLRAAKNAVLRVQQSRAAALLATTRIATETRIVAAPSIRAKVREQKHGVDTALFAPGPQEAPDAAAPTRVLFLANVSPVKGIFTLLDAFGRVREAVPEATLVIGGDARDHLENVRRRIEELGLTECVDLLGNVARHEVPALMHRSAVYCLPSFGDPYATSVIEAFAAGMPVVVTHSGGLAEMVDDLGGFRVTPGAPEELARALVSILRSPELGRRMGTHNRSRAEREFSWDAAVTTLEATYASIVRPVPTTGRIACPPSLS